MRERERGVIFQKNVNSYEGLHTFTIPIKKHSSNIPQVNKKNVNISMEVSLLEKQN